MKNNKKLKIFNVKIDKKLICYFFASGVIVGAATTIVYLIVNSSG